MDTSEILKRVRQIEIKTRGLSNNIFAGEYHSAFKGRGMAFSEVREYQYGDDIRDIDWNVTARFNRPFVKVFEEERELTVMLVIDVSGSLSFGTVSQTKREMVFGREDRAVYCRHRFRYALSRAIRFEGLEKLYRIRRFSACFY